MSVSENRHILSKTSQQSINVYTHAEIEGIDDIDAAFDISDELGVNLEGLDDLEDIKERLLMHIEKPNGNYKRQVALVLEDLNRDDKKKRQKIVQLLENCQRVLKKFEINDEKSEQRRGSAVLEDFLQTERILKHSESDFPNRIRLIESGECIVVVSGETSAGKSSFLNLLLGELVLPVHHNPCTSVITRIAYKESRDVRIIYKNGDTEELCGLGEGELQEKLWNKVFEKDIDEREKATTIKEIQLYLPSALLKCGLVLVDSPGIGENDAMDKVIEEFVSTNDIMGFIYVIKSDNAGGVDEDRLGNLLKVILSHQKKKTEDGGLAFDPKCAIFVCNVWDLVKVDERQDVYNYAVKKLEMYWPGLSQSQVIKLSTFRAKREILVDPDYIVKDFKVFLDCLQDLMSRAMKRKIQSTYKWMETLLIRSVHHLKTLVKRIDSSDKGMADKMKEVHCKLTNLKKKSDSVLQTQLQHISDASRTICQLFRTELQKPQVRFRLVQWVQGETPKLQKDDSWEDIKFQIQGTVLQRISNEFNIWEEEKEELQSLQRKITFEIKSELSILKSDLDHIENELHSDSGSIASDETYPFGKRQSIAVKGNRKMSLLDFTILDSEPLPVRLVSKFLHPIETIKKGIRELRIYEATVLQRKCTEYRKEPLLCAKMVSEKFLNGLLNPKSSDEDSLQTFIDYNMEKPKELLQMIERYLPDLIESNEMLMDYISHCRVNATESRDMYERMMEGLESLKRELMQYGSGFIYVHDFLSQQIRLYCANDKENSEQLKVSDLYRGDTFGKYTSTRILHRGIWTAVQNGFYIPDAETKEQITIRVYLPLAGIRETFAEVAKLRFLNHDCVAEFMGIHHSDSPVPAFIYNEHVKSLRRYKMNTFAKLRDEIPRIIKEVLSGVEYLHSKKMVHMELSINTITVNFNGEVKLTGGCLPRRASFPLDKDTISASDFVCLCPDVLRGEVYIACADIYAIGLLMYELLLDTRAFDKQREMTLDQFVKNVNPKEMLELDTKFSEANMTESTCNLIRWCLEVKPDMRPTIQIITDKADDLKFEPCVDSLKRSVRHPIRKRSNTQELSVRL